MYLPLHNGAERKYFIRISALSYFRIVAVPLLAFTICVIITMFKDFKSANSTHCNVPNVFPSISASIGSYEPQRTIWRTAIYIHSPLRFYLLYLRWKYYRKVIREDLDSIVNLTVFFNAIENFSLLGLTYWTSSSNYSMHEKSFKTFIGCSIFYMCFTCIMLTKYRRRLPVTNKERLSIKLKWRAFIVNIASFALAAYCFMRHNSLCEPYMYSAFGFFEYVVVVSNIVYHLTTSLDLQLSYVYLTGHGIIAE